jgi:hypothetical protein
MGTQKGDPIRGEILLADALSRRGSRRGRGRGRGFRCGREDRVKELRPRLPCDEAIKGAEGFVEV